MIMIPIGWIFTSEVKSSFIRLDKFLNLPELDNVSSENRLDIFHQFQNRSGYFQISDHLGGSPIIEKSEIETLKTKSEKNVNRKPIRIRIDSVSFSHSYGNQTTDIQERANTISDISLNVEEGELVTIMGPVGCGKSTFINGILGEVKRSHGIVSMDGKISYCPQEPWILSETIRHNVTLFGAKFEDDENFDCEWYENVLDCCCLLPDLEQFPAFDLTDVDKITISGGQKSRIALARAIYSCSDIYIFDDILSAVDSAVSSRLMEKLFGPSGLLIHKTCIIATHSVHLIPYSSKIIVLEDGKVSFSGNFDSLKRSKFLFNHIHGIDGAQENFRNEIDDENLDASDNLEIGNNIDGGQADFTVREDFNIENFPNCPVLEEMKVNKKIFDKKSNKQMNLNGKLVAEEDLIIGDVSGGVFLEYINAMGGYVIVFIILFLFVTAQVARQLSQIWIGKWTTQFPENINPSTNSFFAKNVEYSYILFGLSFATFSLNLLRSAVLATFCIFASRILHNKLLDKILYAKMSLFDTNPAGRILNRFSKDIDNIDMPLPLAIQDVLLVISLTVGSLVTISIAIPWMLIEFVPIMSVFLVLQTIYKRSSRELKRLDGISFSHIYSNFMQCFNGLSTIRAYGGQQRFIADFCSLVDTNNSVYWSFQISGRWLGLRLDLLTSIIIFLVSIISLILSKTVDIGLTGVALSESIIITSGFQWGVRQAAELENLFTSVERVVRMTRDTPTEGSYELTDGESNEDGKGSEHEHDKGTDMEPGETLVDFDNVYMRYREELPFVLSGCSFKVNEKERIGIVGRTGSGKSSIVASLFRLVEINYGTISIQGKDIRKRGLKHLLQSMTIVPQDPVQFNGTVRYNLDPMAKRTDADIWDAVERVHMKDKILRICEDDYGIEFCNNGLDAIIKDKGKNFSVGERQLLSLARAILTGTKIIILDEASASIDNYTDRLIQETIRTQFESKTILTIAHRLRTIMDSHRILVIDSGKVIEFDTPMNLINNNGMFSKMVASTGPAESETLVDMAKKCC